MQHAVPLFFRHIEYHAVAENARDMVDHIDAAVVVDGGLNNLARRFVVRHGVEVGDGVAAARLDFRHDLGCGGVGAAHAVNAAAEVVDHDGRAFVRKQNRHAPADTPAGAGNDCHSPFQSVAHACFLSASFPLSRESSSSFEFLPLRWGGVSSYSPLPKILGKSSSISSIVKVPHLWMAFAISGLEYRYMLPPRTPNTLQLTLGEA